MVGQVRCTRCGETKAESEFGATHIRTNRRGDRAGTCRLCNTEYHKEIRHRTEKSAKAKLESISITCSVCSQQKPEGEYRWNSRTGYRGECKECEKTWLRCSDCKEVKKHEDFPPAPRITTGRHSLCHACHTRRMQEKYHGDSGHRARQKKYSRGQKATEARKEYNARPEVKERQKGKHKEYTNWKYHNDPVERNKIEARAAVNFGVKFGFIAKPDACQHPGKYGAVCSGEIQAHHHMGYERENWLNVEWLCIACHKAADMKLRDEKDTTVTTA